MQGPKPGPNQATLLECVVKTYVKDGENGLETCSNNPTQPNPSHNQ